MTRRKKTRIHKVHAPKHHGHTTKHSSTHKHAAHHSAAKHKTTTNHTQVSHIKPVKPKQPTHR